MAPAAWSSSAPKILRRPTPRRPAWRSSSPCRGIRRCRSWADILTYPGEEAGTLVQDRISAIKLAAPAAGERLAAWEAARTGRARLLVGTRSALFTPMPRLELIVLDEEHDASFKQQEGFRYSARDVAVKRAADLGIPVVLGSATPSLESLRNAAQGRYAWHRLRERATRASLPSWRVLDLRQQQTTHGLAGPALEAVTETLNRGEQVMVFLNRRGYSPVLMCRSCGWSGSCERCDANLTWHRSSGRLCCHHCGHQRRAPELCPDCAADALAGAGEGTQQLEEFLARRFEGVPVLRFDRDRVSRKGVLDEQLDEVRRGKPCLMVGTQMLAKGHHFPGVTLVVIVNIDQAMYSADYRALERMGQMIQQVAGRAGRSPLGGRVVLQTFNPEHYVIQKAAGHDYEAFAAQALAVIKDLGLNRDIVNVNGGAIALGHPLGCTGAKLTATLLHEMGRRELRYGMVSMCIGGGMGAAGLFEKV